MGTTVNELLLIKAAISQNLLMMYEAHTDEMVIYRALLVLLYKDRFAELYQKAPIIVRSAFLEVSYFELFGPMEMK